MAYLLGIMVVQLCFVIIVLCAIGARLDKIATLIQNREVLIVKLGADASQFEQQMNAAIERLTEVQPRRYES